MKVEFSVDITPYAQPRPRVTRKGTYEPRRVTEYKNTIRMFAGVHMGGRPPFSAAVYVRVTIRRKYKATSRVFGDGDNHLKAVLDALTGVCYTDDALVVGMMIFKAQSVEEGVDVMVTDDITDFTV